MDPLSFFVINIFFVTTVVPRMGKFCRLTNPPVQNRALGRCGCQNQESIALNFFLVTPSVSCLEENFENPCSELEKLINGFSYKGET